MVKDIKYNGYTSVPADYECPDGDLAGVVNMLPDEYGLSPMFPPVTDLLLDNGYDVIYWHKSNNVNNYIVCHQSVYYYIKVSDVDDDTHTGTLHLIKDLSSDGKMYQVNSIGNTLLVLTEKGNNYFLWENEGQGSYKDLGTHLPELPLSFGLQGEMRRSDNFEHTMDNEATGGYALDLATYFEYEDNTTQQGSSIRHSYTIKQMKQDMPELTQKAFTNTVMGKVNKFIADNTTNAGRFVFPFLVRYAFRLYDGSITMHSAPVLMITNTEAPVVRIGNFKIELNGNYQPYLKAFQNMRVCAMIHQLDYAVVNASALEMLNEWKDIVKSVDIFVSKPLYTFDQNGTIKRAASTNLEKIYSVCKNVKGTDERSRMFYQKSTTAELYRNTFDDSDSGYYFILPQKENETVLKEVMECSNFFLLKSIDIKDLKTERTIIDVNKEYLQSLLNRESMTDDYDSHDNLIPRYSYTYNSRLNITNITKQLFAGFHGQSSVCYTNGFWDYYADRRWVQNKLARSFTIYYFIKENGKDIIVGTESGTTGAYHPFVYLYHPNSNVYKAKIFVAYGVGHYCIDVEMKPHAFLNGSVFFNGWDYTFPGKASDSITPTPIEQRFVNILNKIYSSATNNPFFFPAENISTVGTGEIYALSSASKALSQGQFGEHPLYAFCTDGVWALSVSKTGGFSAVQPFIRDVCLSGHSITQLDSSVVFVSARGIIEISGSSASVLTDTLKLEKIFDLTTLPFIDSLSQLSKIDLEDLRYVELSKYLPECRIIYAYVPQRLIVYNPNYPYAYVYSMKAKQWGIIHTNIHSHINSYPDAYAMTDNNELVNFCEDATTDEEGSVITGIKGIVVTRPLKLDAPDILKTIDTVIQRGTFKKEHIKTALYGSRDLFDWQLIYTSRDHYLRGFRGTPYKYFRIVLLCDLEQNESVFGATIQYTPKLTNQPR